MRFKFFILFIFIFFGNVLNKNSNEKNENKFNENANNFNEEKDNNNNNTENYCNFIKSKYHILKVSPLADFDTVNNKYLKLKAKYSEKNETNENVIKCLDEAFNEFKEEFKKNKKNKLKDLIKYFLFKIIFYILIIIICYFFSWIIYKIQNLSIISICFIFSFMLVDRTIPHFFNGFLNQILFSLFLGEVIYILIRLIFNLIKIKINYNNINKHNE